MEANELRILNNVSYKGVVVHITSIRVDGCGMKSSDTKYNTGIGSITDFEPIPLTEEILLKCGFEESDSNYKIKLSIHEDIESWLMCFDNDSWCGNKGYSLGLHTKDDEDAAYCTETLFHDYGEPWDLHQLQNLYFALTGQELTVTL